MSDVQVNPRRFDELEGKVVVTADGRQIGDVADLEVDTVHWTVTGIRVRLHREVLEQLAVDKPFFSLPRITIHTTHVRGASDTVVLGLTFDALTDLLRPAPDPADPAEPE